ncbi:hypothetical protein [Arthrobacter sp. NPDC057013]|uniref:hypothetical protein n=1 Tax=Arthrobacter sp. NPDC057013 TaxID=3345999 RepID=UPI003635D153
MTAPPAERVSSSVAFAHVWNAPAPCLGILAGTSQLDGTTYAELANSLHQRGDSILDLADDTEARATVTQIVESEPVLGRLVADRRQQHIRQPGGLVPGGDLKAFLPAIEATLNSDPDARLAISLDHLRRTDDAWDAGLSEVLQYVRETELRALTGQLAEDAVRLRRAAAILGERILLDGMTYWNLQCNIAGVGGSIFNFATATEARDLARRIAAAVPGLADIIAARKRIVPF